MSIKTGVCILAIAIAPVCTERGGTMLAQNQNSLRPGISQTQKALEKIKELLEENQHEIARLHNEAQLSFLSGSDIGDSIANFKTGWDAGAAFRDRDYLQSLGHTAEAIAAIWSATKLPGHTAVDYGPKAIDATAGVLELWALLNQQQQLIGNQLSLEQQLFRLQGKDPQSLSEWQNILNNLYGDPAAEHEKYLEWLAQHGLGQEQVARKALDRASSAGPVIVSQVNSGLALLSGSPAVPPPRTNEDPCAKFEKAIAAADNCGKRLAECFQPCGKIASTSAAGACIRACGNCDAAMEESNRAVRDWQACKANARR
jgi:hypothetical protein